MIAVAGMHQKRGDEKVYLRRRRMSRRLKNITIVLVAVSMLLCACSSGGGKDKEAGQAGEKTESGEKKDKITVGATLSDFTISFQAAMYNELLDAQKEYDNIEFILQDGASDSALQVNQIETFITQKVDAILINAVSDAVEPSLKKAMEAGIPVFAVNRSISDENAYSYFIGANDTLSGEQMANCLLDMIERKRWKAAISSISRALSVLHTRRCARADLTASWKKKAMIWESTYWKGFRASTTKRRSSALFRIC